MLTEITPIGIRSSTGNSAVGMTFIGSNPRSLLEGIRLSAAKFTFLGRSHDELSAYSAVIYRDLYQGIDLILRFNGQEIESEYRVAPGADFREIRFHYDAIGGVMVDGRGHLLIGVPAVVASESPPRIYQLHNGVKKDVSGGFLKHRDGTVGYWIGEHAPDASLVIDPVLTYTSQFNGNQTAVATAIATDLQGNVYVTGYTDSVNFPIQGAVQPTSGGGEDAFVIKLNPQGNTLVYATYLGGAGYDQALGIAVDSQGEAVVVGRTSSPNFPIANPAQTRLAGGANAFISKLNTSGNGLVFSTFLGGSASDQANAVAVDGSGNIYLAGDTTSLNFPITTAYQTVSAGRQDGFMTKLTASGAVVYSTYLGGQSDDHISAIAVDSVGNAYVTGSTYSTNFPVSAAFQGFNAGGQDAFVTKMNPSGTGIIFSTYLGGSAGSASSPETGAGIAVDSQRNVYVAGTTSSSNFPVKASLQVQRSLSTNAFLSKFNPTGSALIFSTYLGGSGTDFGNALAVDPQGNSYVAGQTTSIDFPVAFPYQNSLAGLSDAFVVKVNASGKWIAFSTFLGGRNFDTAKGIALDRFGNIYLSGQTQSTNFPQIGGILPQSIGAITAFVSSFGGVEGYQKDFDGDGKLDIGFWNPSGGVWNIIPSTKPSQPIIQPWGLPGDIPVRGDFDGDGKLDIATFRPSNGSWNIIPSSTGVPYFIVWGIPGDIPVSGDFDGDGKTDVAIYRPSNGVWAILLSGSPGGSEFIQWGLPGDIPVSGDFDGDGIADIAIYRPSNGVWAIVPSSTPNSPLYEQWGLPGDVPIPSDYDGDGKTDLAIWRQSNGIWAVVPSSSPSASSYTPLGMTGNVPIIGDIDGDGKSDLIAWNPSNGVWTAIPSSNPVSSVQFQYGAKGNLPLNVSAALLQMILAYY